MSRNMHGRLFWYFTMLLLFFVFVFLHLFTLPRPGVLRDIAGAFCVPPPTMRTEQKQQIFHNTHKTLPQKCFRWLISISLVFLIPLANRKSHLCRFFHQVSFRQCSIAVIPIFQHVGPTSSTRIVIVMDIVHDNEDNQTVVTSCIQKCWILWKGA